MKTLALAMVALVPCLGLAQKGSNLLPSPDQITLTADQELKDGLEMKLRGNVQITTGSVAIYADEADYNPLTGALDARGHVRVSFKNATPRIMIRDSNPEDMPVMK
jgi:lipopolysaccharide assembly outer membrane protein LptD (OstA)